MQNAVSGEIIKNKETKPSGAFSAGKQIKIDQQFIIDFRNIVMDSTNFIWGEPGTPYTDYRMIFRNSKGVIINKAELSFDSYLCIKPQLGTVK